MSMYDRLTNKLDDDSDQPSGLSPLDIAELPGDQRKAMFSLLREAKAATEGMDYDQIAKMLENPDDLDKTLAELVKNGWLIETGEAPHFRYKVNIRRKRGSTLGMGLWASLSERITSRMADIEDAPPQPRRRPALSSDYLDSIMKNMEQIREQTEDAEEDQE